MTPFCSKLLDRLKRAGKVAVSPPAMALLRSYFKKATHEYGELMDLHIDSDRKTITVRFLPKGESEPIEMTATYKLREGESGISLTIQSVKTSREWMTLLSRDFLVPYTLEGVPRAAKIIL